MLLDARFSHLYFRQSLYTPQRGLPAIAGLLVFPIIVLREYKTCKNHQPP